MGLLSKAIILAAGQGTRMGTSKKDVPKCLLKIGQKTILEHIIRSLKEFGITDVSLVIGTKGDSWNVESYEVIKNVCKENRTKLIFNFENDKTENSYSLLLAMKESKKTSILGIDGDVFFGKHVLSSISNALYDTLIVSKRTDDLSEPGSRVVADHNGRVIAVGKDIIPKTSPWYIYGGIIKIGEAHFRSFRKMLSKEEYRPLDISYPLKEFSQKCKLYNLEINEGWININTAQDLEDANELWRNFK